ncbi:conserved hypothetical protein [Neospora caninum Liverpool]|uniref:Uncharacterized protein n=1 Tax=Neospora caninum (strain Liverpool) TaxID=572307 RepID=F0VL16_NEOCL|nr:conserved hypothetical protein [Neospora caninum Liverpool]CBZ54768.1 conserved hypothetical protein [Neospora caninum Liverpool]|eukprot:XP_003884796.1 conserved hypothetical protein [Neospora caninum Liverpool]
MRPRCTIEAFGPRLCRGSTLSSFAAPVASTAALGTSATFALRPLVATRHSRPSLSSHAFPPSSALSPLPSGVSLDPRSSLSFLFRFSPRVSSRPATSAEPRFLSIPSSSSRQPGKESFRDLLSRLEAEETRETEQESSPVAPQRGHPATGEASPRDPPASSLRSSVSSGSAASLTQRELLRKLLQSFSAHYDRNFFYPGCQSAPLDGPSTWHSSSASSPCSPLSGLQALLGICSFWFSEIRPASSKNEAEARGAADAFVRFRLFFSTSADQVSFFSLFSSDRRGDDCAAEAPASSSLVSPSSLCGDVWRLLAPALFPTDVTPTASLVKGTCLLLSTALLQRAVGATATLAGLGLSAATSSLVSLSAYRYLNADSLHVSGTSGPLFFTSALLLSLPGLPGGRVSSLGLVDTRLEPEGHPDRARSRGPDSQGVSSPHRGGDARLEKKGRPHLETRGEKRHGDTGGGQRSGNLRSDKKILSVLPRLPIAATALAVPVFFELALKAPGAFEAVLRWSGRSGEGHEEGKVEGEAETERRADNTGENFNEDKSKSTARESEKKFSGETRGAAGDMETGDARRDEETAKRTPTIAPSEMKTRAAGAGEPNASSPCSPASSSLSPFPSALPPQPSAGYVQERILFETALAAGVSAALERQKEQGKTVSRDLRRARVEAEEAAEAWERQWEALEIRDMRVLGDLLVFLLTFVGARCARIFPR